MLRPVMLFALLFAAFSVHTEPLGVNNTPVPSLASKLLAKMAEVPHGHPPGMTGLAAAHADRFFGMMHTIECNHEHAIVYFVYARIHDREDLEIAKAPELARKFLDMHSAEWAESALRVENSFEEARRSSAGPKPGTQRYKQLVEGIAYMYAKAVVCDGSNNTAKEGFDRSMKRLDALKK